MEYLDKPSSSNNLRVHVEEIVMKCKIPKLVVFILKLGVFLSLSIIFYVYYFSDVARKYRDENTYLSNSHEFISDIKVPILTLCLNDPIAKISVLKKYNLTVKALDEPTIHEQRTLKNLNKTVGELFQQVTYKLKRDFRLYMIKNKYDQKGDHIFRSELLEGETNVNSFQVSIQRFNAVFGIT